MNTIRRFAHNYRVVSTYLASLGLPPDNRCGIMSYEAALRDGAEVISHAPKCEIIRPDGAVETLIHVCHLAKRPRERNWRPRPYGGVIKP